VSVATAPITPTPTGVYKETGGSVSSADRIQPDFDTRYIKMSHYSYPMNDDRLRMLDKLEAETEATTRADAIDMAIKHYLEDKANREEHWQQFTPEQLKLLNTSVLSVQYYPKVR